MKLKNNYQSYNYKKKRKLKKKTRKLVLILEKISKILVMFDDVLCTALEDKIIIITLIIKRYPHLLI